MKRIYLVSLISLTIAIAIAGCSDDNNNSTNPPPPPGNSVSISGFAFSPSSLTVSVGDTVTWTNHDAVSHTSTSNTGVWDSGLIGQNDSFMRVFSTAGAFPYHCTPHPQMTGTITVQ
jgi:plastocyanin